MFGWLKNRAMANALVDIEHYFDDIVSRPAEYAHAKQFLGQIVAELKERIGSDLGGPPSPAKRAMAVDLAAAAKHANDRGSITEFYVFQLCSIALDDNDSARRARSLIAKILKQ